MTSLNYSLQTNVNGHEKKFATLLAVKIVRSLWGRALKMSSGYSYKLGYASVQAVKRHSVQTCAPHCMLAPMTSPFFGLVLVRLEPQGLCGF